MLCHQCGQTSTCICCHVGGGSHRTCRALQVVLPEEPLNNLAPLVVDLQVGQCAVLCCAVLCCAMHCWATRCPGP